MDEFTQQFHAVNLPRLKAHVASLRAPCYESELLHVAFPELDISSADPLVLYQRHFVLFYALYQLQAEFAREGRYLHIHFMRTMLAPYPPAGKCRYFEELTGMFCPADACEEKEYCAFHLNQIGETALEERSTRYFYLDTRNFYKLDRDTITAFINGTWELLAHYDDYHASFKILGLAETSDFAIIKKRYKQLAREHHPDRGAESHEKFLEINNAYQLLMRIIPAMR